MDTACVHLPYILAAYAFGMSVFGLLAYWIFRTDHKTRQRLAQWKSDVS